MFPRFNFRITNNHEMMSTVRNGQVAPANIYAAENSAPLSREESGPAFSAVLAEARPLLPYPAPLQRAA